MIRVQRNALAIVALMSTAEGDETRTNTLGGEGTPLTRPILKRRKRRYSSNHSVNLGKLDETTLRRYRRYFNLNVRKDCERDELVFAVRRHFARTKVNEQDVIDGFLQKMGRPTTGLTPSTTDSSLVVPHD